MNRHRQRRLSDGTSPSLTSKVLLFILRPLGIISWRPCPRRGAAQEARYPAGTLGDIRHSQAAAGCQGPHSRAARPGRGDSGPRHWHTGSTPSLLLVRDSTSHFECSFGLKCKLKFEKSTSSPAAARALPQKGAGEFHSLRQGTLNFTELDELKDGVLRFHFRS